MVSLNDVLLAMSNIPVDDPIAEIWGRGLQGGHKIIEYTGTPPITITADGNALLDYRIYGNTVQNGTPTPENPVDVVGCGERTENLFDFNAVNPDNGYAYGKQLVSDGNVYTFTQTNVSEYISITPLSSYTFTYGSQYNDVYAVLYNAKREFVRSIRYNGRKVITYQSQEDETYLRLTYLRSKENTVMLNLGSAALPYEPHGYKLPILSNSIVTNIYLGEAETTRRIKKLVLTGDESWTIDTYFRFSITLSKIKSSTTRAARSYCSHYKCLYHAEPYDDNWNNVYYQSSTALIFHDKRFTTVEDFKSYLQQQYDAGTPVTIWYVLAVSETAVVNEPLMKIGDYADTLSMEQADVSIPTNNGSTAIDYDGAPKPSQMYIKYRSIGGNIWQQ